MGESGRKIQRHLQQHKVTSGVVSIAYTFETHSRIISRVYLTVFVKSLAKIKMQVCRLIPRGAWGLWSIMH